MAIFIKIIKGIEPNSLLQWTPFSFQNSLLWLLSASIPQDHHEEIPLGELGVWKRGWALPVVTPSSSFHTNPLGSVSFVLSWALWPAGFLTLIHPCSHLPRRPLPMQCIGSNPTELRLCSGGSYWKTVAQAYQSRALFPLSHTELPGFEQSRRELRRRSLLYPPRVGSVKKRNLWQDFP